jgi:hypothetical protein
MYANSALGFGWRHFLWDIRLSLIIYYALTFTDFSLIYFASPAHCTKPLRNRFRALSGFLLADFADGNCVPSLRRSHHFGHRTASAVLVSLTVKRLYLRQASLCIYYWHYYFSLDFHSLSVPMMHAFPITIKTFSKTLLDDFATSFNNGRGHSPSIRDAD